MRTLVASRHRTAVLVTATSGLVAAGVAQLAVGGPGPVSALLGTVMVLAFFWAGSLPFAVAGDGTGGRAAIGFLVLGATYVLRIVVGVVVYAVASRASGLDSQVVGLTVIACALVWTNTQVFLGLSRRHRPTLDL